MVPDFAAAVRGKKADKFDLLGSPPENFKYMWATTNKATEKGCFCSFCVVDY